MSVVALLERVRATGLLEPGAATLVMLSGGRDSVCLLDVAAEIAGPAAVRALHVDYRLRPESGEDARFCAALCDRRGVPLEVVRAGEPAGNVQAWAREVRYAEAARLAGTGRIASGHTASDQVETILYRLAASPGRRALLGMPERSGALVRPLLAAGVTRVETAEWCLARGLEWREDATNASDRFARGRVRHELLPAMRSVHPRAEENVLATAALLRAEADVLDELVDGALAGGDGVALERLAALPPALARLVVRRLAEDAAGGLCPRAAGRLDDLLALDPAGAMLDVGDGARAVVEKGVLRFARTPSLDSPRP